MEHILEVKDLQTSFLTSSGEVKAVRGVSFFVNKGESVGIVGESGSGKSVTSLSVMQLLVGTGRIIGGSVKLNGRELVGLSPKEMRSVRGKEVAMIFQDPMTSLNPLIPVGEQVGEMLWSHDKSLSKAQREERVIDLFRMVRIPEPETRLKSFPHEFSGGMRQRVMIAMALACKPDLLIADEPTTALDVSIQDQILKLMRSIQKEMGMSIMFITHDLGVVAELCSRVLVMYGGLIMEEANIYDVFENPLHPYTMGLIASIPDINQDKSKKLQPIIGSPPDMIHPPEGCPFAPRCPYACRICLHQLPPVFSAGEGHKSRCWLLAEDAPSSGNPLKGRKGAKE
ncbi:MAG: ABC transporter ATP-binding protein [Oscillospiraceae bacterium]|nr:ABC transporter ATP-binding protein [Oscillospiraceae bacterium]